MPPYLAKNKNDRMTSNHFWAAYSPVKKWRKIYVN